MTVILWVIFAYYVAKYAKNKGGPFWMFLILSLILSPLIGFIIAYIIPEEKYHKESRIISEENMKKCKYCAELVKNEAVICKHCGKELEN